MRTLSIRSLLILPLVVGLYACSQWQADNPASPSSASVGQSGAEAGASTPLTAVVRFGRPDTGSPFGPVPEHDRSGHAKDSLTPTNVVIDAGGFVKFEVPPNVHQLAIYDKGKEPSAVNTGIQTARPGRVPARAADQRSRHAARLPDPLVLPGVELHPRIPERRASTWSSARSCRTSMSGCTAT